MSNAGGSGFRNLSQWSSHCCGPELDASDGWCRWPSMMEGPHIAQLGCLGSHHQYPQHRQGQNIYYYTVLYCTILCYAMLYYTVLYCTVLCYAMLCYAILYYTILYNVIRCVRHHRLWPVRFFSLKQQLQDGFGRGIPATQMGNPSRNP